MQKGFTCWKGSPPQNVTPDKYVSSIVSLTNWSQSHIFPQLNGQICWLKQPWQCRLHPCEKKTFRKPCPFAFELGKILSSLIFIIFFWAISTITNRKINSNITDIYFIKSRCNNFNFIIRSWVWIEFNKWNMSCIT